MGVGAGLLWSASLPASPPEQCQGPGQREGRAGGCVLQPGGSGGGGPPRRETLGLGEVRV